MKKYHGPTKHFRKGSFHNPTWVTFQDGDVVPESFEGSKVEEKSEGFVLPPLKNFKTKRALDKFAESHGVELDRRKSKEDMYKALEELIGDA